VVVGIGSSAAQNAAEQPHYIKLYNNHMESHEHPTVLQLTLFLMWLVELLLYITKPSWDSFFFRFTVKYSSSDSEKTSQNNGSVTSEKDVVTGDAHTKQNETQKETAKESSTTEAKEQASTKLFSGVKPPPTFEEFLKYTVIMGLLTLSDTSLKMYPTFSIMSKCISINMFNISV